MDLKRTGILCVLVTGLCAYAAAQTKPAAEAPTAGQTAAQHYKNIQVLKSVPADELIPTMQFVSSSLGVGCNFCHVQGAFEKDDKDNKKTAREMMRMQLAIDADNFKNRQAVTCYSCHRGNALPVSVPVIPATTEAREEAPGAPVNPPPAAAEQVVARYVTALGGEAALARIATLVETGELEQGKNHLPLEIYAQAPDRRVSVVKTPRGESVTAFNGQSGWMAAPGRPVREMSAGQLDAARTNAALFLGADPAHLFQKLQAVPAEKVGDVEANVVLGINPGHPPVKMYFDPSSGLLLRFVHYQPTALGLFPTQVDLGDYREAAGVKTPYRWTVAEPDGGFTVRVQEAKQNAPVDNSKFARP